MAPNTITTGRQITGSANAGGRDERIVNLGFYKRGATVIVRNSSNREADPATLVLPMKTSCVQ